LKQIEKVDVKNHHGVHMITLWKGMLTLNFREHSLEYFAGE